MSRVVGVGSALFLGLALLGSPAQAKDPKDPAQEQAQRYQRMIQGVEELLPHAKPDPVADQILRDYRAELRRLVHQRS